MNPYTQYNFQFDSELDQNFNSPEMSIITGGTVYNNQYFALGYFLGTVTPKYFMLQIDFSLDFEITRVINYPVTFDDLDFSTNFYSIASNGSHLWLLSSHDTQNIRHIALDLSITQDIRLPEASLNKNNLLFIGHLDLIFHKQSLWILEEYQNAQNEPLIFLNQYSLDTNALLTSIPIPKALNLECASIKCRIFVDNDSYWIFINNERILKEYSWDHQQISQLTIPRSAIYRDLIIYQDIIFLQ